MGTNADTRRSVKSAIRALLPVIVIAAVVPLATRPAAAAVQPISEFATATGTHRVTPVALGPDGNIWWADEDGTVAGNMTTAGTPIKTVAVDPAPQALTAGPANDPNTIWVASQNSQPSGAGAGELERIDVATDTVTNYPLPACNGNAPLPTSIVVGPDGNGGQALWFTAWYYCPDLTAFHVGRALVTPQSSGPPTVSFTMVNTTTKGDPEYITEGPDGNMWFTESGVGKVGKIDVATFGSNPSGAITEYSLPSQRRPEGITTGPDGNLWIVDSLFDEIERVNPSTGAVTEFPSPFHANPQDIVTGPDAKLWYTDQSNGDIDSFDPTTSMTAEFQLPVQPGTSFPGEPFNIVVGPTESGGSQNIWFSDSSNNLIGKLNVATADASALAAAPDASSITLTEGQAWSGNLATFRDADGSASAATFTATINWGDGSSSNGTVVANGDGTFSVSGSHVYAEETPGCCPSVAATITDSDGSTAQPQIPLTISDAALNATGVSGTAKVKKFNGVAATFTDADPNAALSDYSATIDWGDGTTSSGTVATGTSSFSVSGSHIFRHKIVHTLMITIKDSGGATTTVTSTL